MASKAKAKSLAQQFRLMVESSSNGENVDFLGFSTLVNESGCTLSELLAEHDELSDETLVLAIQNNLFADLAYEELMESRYKLRLFGFLLTMVPPTGVHGVDDIVQELHAVKLWPNRLKKFNPQRGSFSKFLFTVARNYFVDMIRRTRTTYPIEDGSNLPSFEPNSVFAAILNEEIGLLSLQEKRILLGLASGFTSAELASQLDKTPEQIHRLTYKARKHLKSRLDGGLEDSRRRGTAQG